VASGGGGGGGDGGSDAVWIAAARVNEKNGVEKREKGNTQFSNHTYIHRLRRALNGSLAPHIFIGGIMSLINICHIYSLVTWLNQQIYRTNQNQIRSLIYYIFVRVRRPICILPIKTSVW
jgi:hypothetical protein